MRSKKIIVLASLLVLLAFAIPIEHKYDKLFRFYSLTLIPSHLKVPASYPKMIYFYASDLIAILLFSLSLFWRQIPLRQFLSKGAIFLWTLLFCAFLSIAASPYASYLVPYTRLLQLLTPILLFSSLAHAFTFETKEKISRLMLGALIITAIFQSGIAIAQYFHQGSLGLRFFGEIQASPENLATPSFEMLNGQRWIFDRIFDRISSTPYIMRSSGTLPHPNVLGGFLALSILASYSFLLDMTKWRFWIALTLPLQFFAMAVTYSRSALFGWAIGSFVWFSLLLFKRGIKSFAKDSGSRFLSFAVLFSVLMTAFLLHDQYLHRGGIVNYNEVAQQSDGVRSFHQKVSLKMTWQNPLLGVGFTQYSIHAPQYFPPNSDPLYHQTATHNIYLFLAAETGLISLGAFLLFLGCLARSALRVAINPITASLIASFIAFLFIGGCDFYPLLFQQGKLMFFSIAGLLAAHSRISSEEVYA
ncbi:MAG: O-antigen ligase family protein [Chlamydiota bacterium]